MLKNEKNVIDGHIGHTGIPSTVVGLPAPRQTVAGQKTPTDWKCQSNVIII